MKKIITTLTFALLLCTQSQAQSCNNGQEGSKPAPDAKLISTEIVGNCRTSTWLVKKQNDENTNEFSVRYKINLSRLISTYDDNHVELVKLREFIDGLMANSHDQVVRLEIEGFASPDGTAAINERLANERAQDCCEYLKKEYSEFSKIPCTTKGIASPWSATKMAVTNSSVPMKSEVLKIVESGSPASAIESRLRQMPSSWSYFKSKILPPMRCVEINVIYNSWEKVVTRTPIASEVEEVDVVNNYFIVMEEDPSQLMIYENSNAPLDFPAKEKMKWKFRR